MGPQRPVPCRITQGVSTRVMPISPRCAFPDTLVLEVSTYILFTKTNIVHRYTNRHNMSHIAWFYNSVPMIIVSWYQNTTSEHLNLFSSKIYASLGGKEHWSADFSIYDFHIRRTCNVQIIWQRYGLGGDSISYTEDKKGLHVVVGAWKYTNIYIVTRFKARLTIYENVYYDCPPCKTTINSLRPSDAYMRQLTIHHWFR